MQCPDCKKPLSKTLLHNVEVDYCPICLGLWFEDEELRWAKDEKDSNLNWLDVDLWKYLRKFEISRSGRLCPECRMPLYEVDYDKSKVRIDVCTVCRGAWLDRGEFVRIIQYLKEKSDYQVLHHFSKSLSKQGWEVLSGPDTFKEEVVDLITLLKLLTYKFFTQQPFMAEVVKNLLYK